MSCRQFSIIQQNESSCWLYSILNGLLLSDRIKPYINLKELTDAEKLTSLSMIKNIICEKSCPLLNERNIKAFLYGISDIQKKEAENEYFQVNCPNSTKRSLFSTNVISRIPATGLTRILNKGRIEFEGKTLNQINEMHKDFYQLMFGKTKTNTRKMNVFNNTLQFDVNSNSPILALYNPKKVQDKIINTITKNTYYLDHVILAYTREENGNFFGHVVSGVIKQNGCQIIADSNDDRTYNSNWLAILNSTQQDDPKTLENFQMTTYSYIPYDKLVSIKCLLAVYIM